MIDLANLRIALDRAVADAEPTTLPDLVAICAATQARAIARLATPSSTPATPTTWHTAEQIAAALNVKPSAVFEWARARRIPCEKFGRFSRFNLDAVRAALASNAKMPALGTPRKPKRDRGQSTPLTARLPGGEP
jgi:excisionase family DNA binding protein